MSDTIISDDPFHIVVDRNFYNAINMSTVNANSMAQVLEMYRPELAKTWYEKHYPVMLEFLRIIEQKIYPK